jgi:hypothetical protein
MQCLAHLPLKANQCRPAPTPAAPSTAANNAAADTACVQQADTCAQSSAAQRDMHGQSYPAVHTCTAQCKAADAIHTDSTGHRAHAANATQPQNLAGREQQLSRLHSSLSEHVQGQTLSRPPKPPNSHLQALLVKKIELHRALSSGRIAVTPCMLTRPTSPGQHCRVCQRGVFPMCLSIQEALVWALYQHWVVVVLVVGSS